VVEFELHKTGRDLIATAKLEKMEKRKKLSDLPGQKYNPPYHFTGTKW
jgi:hypothetical protein